MAKNFPSLLVFGAHPDDCDITAGGLATLYTQQGGRVLFVSVTNGDAGHHIQAGAALARRRIEEARAAAAVSNLEVRVLDNHDGELLPTLDRRREIIGIIREFQPDLVLTPRPNDYHPDHRYTSVLVQDAAYMVTVPNIRAHVEHLRRDPVIMYVRDHFQKPYPFTPDVAIDIDSVIEQKFDMLHAHESQMYEWLAYNARILEQVPEGSAARRAWLVEQRGPAMEALADRFRDLLIQRYGPEKGATVRYAEAFEACEYGAPLTDEAKARLFPF
jgi:N-acetylglucosamine malate deacetylase 1